MGGKGSGKIGNLYEFTASDRKRLPPVTWKGKSLYEMDAKEIRNAVRYLCEGWRAALPDKLLYDYCGLDEERVSELKRRDPKLAEIEEGRAGRLVAIARVNVGRSIEEGNVKDSRWLLEHVDNEFKPQSKLEGGQQIIVPVEDKQAMIESEIKNIIEGVEVEFSDESTESPSE